MSFHFRFIVLENYFITLLTQECNSRSSMTTPPPPSSPSTFIPPPLSENMWTEAQWKRAQRTGRLRREVISAVSPQRFPHSTLISSNNVSQTFQLFKKMGAERKWARGARWWRIRPLPRSSSTPLIFLFSLSSPESDYGDLIVFDEFLWFVYFFFYFMRGVVKLRKCRSAAFLLHHINHRHDIWRGNDLHKSCQQKAAQYVIQ